MDLKRLKGYIHARPKTKKAVGVVLVAVGFVALVTPFTPGAWLALIGLEFLGIRLLFLDRFTPQFLKRQDDTSHGTESV